MFLSGGFGVLHIKWTELGKSAENDLISAESQEGRRALCVPRYIDVTPPTHTHECRRNPVCRFCIATGRIHEDGDRFGRERLPHAEQLHEDREVNGLERMAVLGSLLTQNPNAPTSDPL